MGLLVVDLLGVGDGLNHREPLQRVSCLVWASRSKVNDALLSRSRISYYDALVYSLVAVDQIVVT